MTIYNTGTVSVTNGNAVVTGSGTAWAVSLVTGGMFSSAGVSVPILSVDSDTSLTLAYAWPGTTAAGAVYAIARENSEAADIVDLNDKLSRVLVNLSLAGITPDASGTIAERDALTLAVGDKGFLFLHAEIGVAFAFYRWNGTAWDGPFAVANAVATGGVSSIVAGSNVTIDNTNPAIPVISATSPLPTPVASTFLKRNAGNTAYDAITAIDSTDLSYTQTGTGGGVFPLFTILKERIRAARFGADPSASAAVNRAAINNAVNAAGANGALIELLSGQFDVDSTVIPLAANCTIAGEGEATIIRTTSATANIFDVAAAFVTIRDIQMAASVTRSGGNFVNVGAAAHRFELRNFHMAAPFQGIAIVNGVSSPTIRGGKIFNTVAATGIPIRIDGGLDITLADICTDAAGGSQPFAGIYIDNAGDVSIEDCQLLHAGQALYLNPGVGQTITSVFANNTFFDNSTRGLYGNAAGGAIARCIFDECWFSSSTNEGIRLATSAGGTIDGMDFINPHIFLNGGGGAFVNDSGVTNVSFINPAVCQNTGDGLKFASGVNKYRIIGGKVGDGYGLTGNTGYGINLVGTSDNFEISSVNLSGNTSGPINTTLAPSPTAILRSNIGVPRIVPDMQIASIKSAKTALTNSITTEQAIFTAANDTLTLKAATTYRFRARIGLNTGATSHSTAFSLGGTATFTALGYSASTTSAALGVISTPQMVSGSGAGATTLCAASTATRTDILIEGEMRINAAGTIIPQISFSAGPTGTCEVDFDSFFEIWGVGPNSADAVGDWS